jgi:glutamate-1-semialdehyde 2,1-aminomutase
MSDPVSERLFERAKGLIVGGVNSPVRAFKAVGGNPVFIARARGSRVYGADDHEYIDYVGSWGPAILGHAHPTVVERVKAACDRGLSFGAPTELEVQLASALREKYPSLELMRCVSSGTEATMSALRAARGFTGRSTIVKFTGCYHGHSDALLVKAGSGAATFGVPDSAGVPPAMVEHTLTLDYNDIAALRSLFIQHPDSIAAVIVEPVAGNMGCVPPEPGFLPAILELCDQHGAVSIFDEVMTGSRLAPGGAQQLYGLRPAMTCLGKVVGGGMPLAVYGGRRKIMEQVAPVGPVYQAGTLSGNPLATTAGLATLELLNDGVYQRLEQLGARLEAGINQIIGKSVANACVQRVGSMLTVFFKNGPIRSWQDAKSRDTQRFGKWHQALLQGGVYWPPAQFEAAFISAAHTEPDIDTTLLTIERAFSMT